MRINIVTNLNGAGLERNFDIYYDVFTKAGHTVRPVQFNHYEEDTEENPVDIADVNIFDEVVVPELLNRGKKNFVAPHPEWWYGEAWNKFLPYFDAVLCKTYDCASIFSKLHDNVIYTGFYSRDFYDENIERVKRVLHVAGKSDRKNTVAIINAWKTLKPDLPITIISSLYDASGIEGVSYHKWVEESELHKLLNSHMIHLIPSSYEGFGHSIWEAMACKNVPVVINKVPMYETIREPDLLLESGDEGKKELATTYEVLPETIAKRINALAAKDDGFFPQIGNKLRQKFESQIEYTNERLLGVVNG